MTPEGYVKSKVREIFRKHNVHYHHIPRSGYGNNGAPDYVCNPKEYCEVECKSVKGKSKGKQTELQKINETCCRDSGGMYWLVDENSLPTFEAYIKGRMTP